MTGGLNGKVRNNNSMVLVCRILRLGAYINFVAIRYYLVDFQVIGGLNEENSLVARW